MAAARLADVGTRDSQPLVLPRGCQHATQQLTVAGLEFIPLAERQPRGGDPLGQCVPHLLELIEARDSGLAEVGSDTGVEIQPGKGLGAKAGELMLQAADLAPHLSAREALVASNAKRRKRVSFEQIRHKLGSSVDHQPAAVP